MAEGLVAMHRQYGFSYVIVMFLVAMVSIISVRAMENTQMTLRREKEAELMMVGLAYRNAIRSYYENSPGTAKTYPQKMEGLGRLINDTGRTTRPQRHLRQLWRDPITGSKDWGLVYSGDDLIGVYSLSNQEPIKKDGFPPELASFKDAKAYSGWQFVYQPVPVVPPATLP
ncbi:type II secretion system protein [Duganella sp. BuS-21]|uniref:type II secretion system protein n=1 Tax=Duganella sp. BuS-21 TaxID=2943848 RepID=UPI0035A71124